MNDLLGVTVDDLVVSLKSRRIRIPSEIGAFVALETCEALMRGPAIVRGQDVRIAEDGVVSIFAPPNSATPEEAARSVCRLLATLLVAAGTGVPAVLISLVERGPGRGAIALERLQSELESSLVPLNRAAARRVLSRMIREARRASVRPDSGLDAIPDEQVDDALDDFLGAASPRRAAAPSRAAGASELEPLAFGSSEAPLSDPFADPTRDRHPISSIPPSGAPSVESLDSGLLEPRSDEHGDEDPEESEPTHEFASEPPTATARSTMREPPRSPPPPKRASLPASTPRPLPEPAPLPSGMRGAPAPWHEDPAAPAPEPEVRRVTERSSDRYAAARAVIDEFDAAPPEPRSGNLAFWALAFVVVGLVGIAGVAVLRPDLVDRALGREPAPEAPVGPTAEEQAAALRAHRARFGALTVRSTPDRAQVLLFVGRGPAIATELPVGMAYELVAIADGRAPTRAVVPADAVWEQTAEGPRYELAMQTGETEMAATSLVLGDTRLPRDALGSPSATLGSIRVVTHPPGAKVYLLVGFTPEVHVQNVRTDEVVEVLVYRDDHVLERAVVAPSDWREGPDGTRTAEIDVTLTPRPRGR
jgi:hypothetical protein